MFHYTDQNNKKKRLYEDADYIIRVRLYDRNEENRTLTWRDIAKRVLGIPASQLTQVRKSPEWHEALHEFFEKREAYIPMTLPEFLRDMLVQPRTSRTYKTLSVGKEITL